MDHGPDEEQGCQLSTMDADGSGSDRSGGARESVAGRHTLRMRANHEG
jgi:hypothetical protein